MWSTLKEKEKKRRPNGCHDDSLNPISESLEGRKSSSTLHPAASVASVERVTPLVHWRSVVTLTCCVFLLFLPPLRFFFHFFPSGPHLVHLQHHLPLLPHSAVLSPGRLGSFSSWLEEEILIKYQNPLTKWHTFVCKKWSLHGAHFIPSSCDLCIGWVGMHLLEGGKSWWSNAGECEVRQRAEKEKEREIVVKKKFWEEKRRKE